MRVADVHGGRPGGARRLAAVLLGAGLLLAGCLPAAGPAAPGAAPANAPSAGPKTLRLGVIAQEEPKAGFIMTTASVALVEYMYAFHNGLTVYDAQSSLQPRLAERVPTVEGGDWKILPDGQMEVTWKLRSNVKWHDGVQATAEDFAFGLKVFQDPDFPLAKRDSARLISQVTTPDPTTLVVRWKQTHIDGNVSSPRDIPALPAHLMSDLYEKGDKQAFFASPLWTSQWVGLGPYRLGEWVEGTRLDGLAFDDYFLGRPRIDRLILQFVGDSGGIFANLLAGAVDMVWYGSLETPQITELKKVWETTGAGTTLITYTGSRAYSFQLRNPDAPWADLRVRRGLAHMLDRQALVETLEGGVGSPADTIVLPNDPSHALLEQRGLSRYPFDLGQAQRLLADASWPHTPSDGYRSSSGTPLTLDITFTDSPTNATEAQAVAGQWKAAGLPEVTLSPISGTAPAAVRNELRNTFSGVQGISAVADLTTLGYTTDQIGTAANRWSGTNRGGYSNPTYDRLYEQATITLDPVQRTSLIADFLKLLADDVPMINLFYEVGASGAVRKGIRGPGAAGLPRQELTSWNIHEWEMD